MSRLVRGAAALSGVAALVVMIAGGTANPAGAQTGAAAQAITPIQHVVVIFQENISFDHYFATYPVATNSSGEPAFHAAAGTPSVNGLTPALLTKNLNSRQPYRLGRAQAVTCDMDHDYTAEQKAVNGGLMDRFVEETGPMASGCDRGQVMAYFDGNTVTALWNYAQHYAMSDYSFGTTYGPSTPGALNLISGQTHGATPPSVQGRVASGTVYSDLDPTFDDCSKTPTAAMGGKNIGDLLNAKNLTWGFFEGGFRATNQPSDTVKAVCDAAHKNIGGGNVVDYIPHHQPFQYYQSTANPHHLPPSSVAMIGRTDQANHQYDIADFFAAADSGHLPAVSYLKAPAYQDGHAGYSNPIDEQTFLVTTINHLMRLPTWSSTAVIISYDDSDGWYDHVLAPVVSPSNDPALDALAGPGNCGRPAQGAYLGRCGYGPRLPLLVISMYAKPNFVDHSLTDQSSVLRLIEDNWSLGRIGDQSMDAMAGSLQTMFSFASAQRPGTLYLNPQTGEPTP
jgi:phospholipase C